jgi:hypothetical protein
VAFPDEKRSELRLEDEVAVMVETCSSPDGKEQPTKIVISRTVDVSANGIQVVMDRPLSLKSMLQLCVEVGHDRRFFLTGEVMWVMETEESKRYLTGFQLLVSEQTDILGWKTYIYERLKAMQ